MIAIGRMILNGVWIMTDVKEMVEKAFEEFSAPYDLEGDEWLDMDVVEIFRRGYLAGAKAENEACAGIAKVCWELWDRNSNNGGSAHHTYDSIRARYSQDTNEQS